MPAKNNKQTKQKKNDPSFKFESAGKSISVPGILKDERVINYILGSLVLAYCGFYIFKIYSQLAVTFFWSDENVHAYISSVILNTGSIPAILPEDIYGGFPYSYPPFFHVVGALVMAVAGFPALKYTNLILLILFLIGFYFLIRKFYGDSEALLACILISISPTIAINTIRFMTEMISMVLIFFSFFFLIAALKKPSVLYAIVSGLATGLLLLSKQLGVVVVGFYCLLFVWFYFKHKKDLRLMLYVIGTSAVIFIPYFIWATYNGIEVFGFLSIFFGKKPEWATEAVKSFRAYDSSIKEFGYLFYYGNGLAITASILIPLYQFIRTRTKDRPQNYIFLMTLYLAAVMVVWHITNPRHTITLLPLMAFLFGYAVRQVVANKIVIRVIIVCLVFIASYNVFHLPNYRGAYNAPPGYIELSEIIKKDYGSYGKTLAINAFDTAMYTGKPVIWPFPDLRTIPVDLFEEHTPESLYKLFKKYEIDYIVVNFTLVTTFNKFVGRNYPRAFVDNCEALAQKGKLSFQTVTKTKRFMLLKVL